MAYGLFESMKAKGVHVATVTVAALVEPAKHGEAVAENFWRLYAQPKRSWTVETKYTG